MEIDHSGKVISRNITKGIIKSRKKMNYDAVQDILEGKSTSDTVGYDYLDYIANKNDTVESIALNNNMTVDELKSHNPNCDYKEGSIVKIPVSVILKNMHVLSKVLKAEKNRRGELEFVGDERKYKFDENDEFCEEEFMA